VIPPAGSSDRASSRFGDGGTVQFVDLHAAEHSWEVSPRAAVHGYGFNGQVPGPVIEATVGDRLLVQFSNGMDQPSTLVWDSPSVAATPMSTSALHWVEPGGSHQSEHSLTHPGAFLYWATSQLPTPNILGGLYGVLLVTGPAEPAVDEERILVVHHAELNAVHRDETQDASPVIGRPGPPLLLINGVRHALIDVRAGSRERWRILNAATDVQLRLSLPPRPAQISGPHDRRRNCSDVLISQATTLSAARRDLQIGPFTRGHHVTLDAVFASDGRARQHRQLLTCQVI
jgi:FtsP/CotA-like multicopper oxidase with cupredoxin domain